MPNISEEDVRLTAKIIEESRNVFSERFHSRRFYVVIYPVAGRYFGPRLLPYLKTAGIKYFDYSRNSDRDMEDTLPHGSRPSARSYHTLAAKLAQDLGLTGIDS